MMTNSSVQSFDEVKTIVQKWWFALQHERKCNSTNTVSKVVNHSSEEIQESIRKVISEEIKTVIQKCFESKDLTDIQNACNAINGCFDNFIHAVDAVRYSFVDVISFIDFGITECHCKLLSKCGAKNFILLVLELLHTLSRILILVLKLKRTFNVERGKRIVNDTKPNEINDIEFVALKQILPGLTSKIGLLLSMDDVLIDTKNNLVMAGVLIREILIHNEEALIKYHKEFITTVPLEVSDENFKLNIIKFLVSSAIINSWSVNIIDQNSTFIYLRFFISLCENYSSETPIILNTSRTLLTLIKHECFKEFVNMDDKEKVHTTVNSLLSCIFMLLEHPISCVRHSAKDFLHLLSVHSSLQPVILNSVFKLPKDKRSYFISVAALANEMGSRVLIEKNQNLPNQLLDALCDPTIVSHVSYALENIILRDDLAEKNFPQWCETWIVPLLVSLMKVLPIIAADIDKLLEKTFKKYPESVIYVTNKWSHPTSGEELRYVITALKISHKQGFKMKTYSHISPVEETSQSGNMSNLESPDKKWNNLINEKLLQHCLHQRNDEIRISAFSLIIEAHKTTKIYTENDFKLIMYFLKYNLNNQQPSTRQKVLGLIRKMLVRFSESKVVLLKQIKNNIDQDENSSKSILYDEFLESLVEFCFDNIFIGCNFNRLNTVLNILFLCFENVKGMSLNPIKTNYYWSKFLVAVDSSYEENKQLAAVLCEKLNFLLLDSNKPENAKALYEKAFNLCSHMEPPDVLTGSYLLQILTKLPSSKSVLLEYFVQDQILDDVNFYCIQILFKNLKDQVAMAKLDLMTSSACGPMYGTLFAIRLIFRNVDFSGDSNEDKTSKWGKILNDLLSLCFEMTQIVGCVVNSSSPEGHLPMDFQTNFENMLSIKDSNVTSEGFNKTSETMSKVSKKEIFHLITETYDNLIHKFRKLEKTINSHDYDAYETIRSLKCLSRENKVLMTKLKLIAGETNEYLNEKSISLDKLNQLRGKLEMYLEKLDKTNSVVEWPATAQVLLLCAWRSIKETSLYFGDLVSKLPLESGVKLGLLTSDTIIRIGEELKHLLCEIKHRGAFEHAYIGFTHLVNSLWKCSDKSLNNLPKKWLEEIGEELETPLKDQKMRLCATRRSAGLPFLVQAIICSEITSIKSPTPSSLHYIMKSLLGIVENGVAENSESKIHALNILRALFKDAQLGEHIAPYVSRALMIAIRGSRASTWSERNSSSLLFSSLMIRIFGVARSRDEISKKNRMTSRTFFQRYSELYDFLLSEMELVYPRDNCDEGLFSKPSLYLVLLVLGRLYPPPTEDSENIDLSDFLPYINMSRRNPVLKIRELGARTLVSLIPPDRLVHELDDSFSLLSHKIDLIENERHGILLQIKALLTESGRVIESMSKERFEENKISWLENTKWMLQMKAGKSEQVNNFKRVPFITLATYVKVLHILFKNDSCLREKVSDLIISAEDIEKLFSLKALEQSIIPGIFLFLESFFLLKLDVLSHFWLDSNDSESREKLIELIMFMLRCNVSEVQSISLTILYSCTRDDVNNFEDDSFDGSYGGLVEDLLIYKNKDSMESIRKEILSNFKLVGCVVEELNKVNSEYFESKTVHRLWMGTVTGLVMRGVVPIRHPDEPDSQHSLRIESVKTFLGAGDKELSTNALICYSIYLLEEISTTKKKKKGEGMTAEERSILSSILNEYSSPDADVRERLAVAKIIDRCFENLIDKSMIRDPLIMKIWTIPFKLLADESSNVRFVAEEFVHKMESYTRKEIPPEKLLMKTSTLDWPHLPLVTLKAQECLLDSFINILGPENLLYFIVQMLIMAVSSLSDIDYGEACYKDEFGVFEKGNPNPYCEVLALSDLMSRKLSDLGKAINLKALMTTPLDFPLRDFILKSLNLSEFQAETLMETIEAITIAVMKEGEKSKKEFTTPQIQVKNLRIALGLPEISSNV